ncbi:uncharacterized protein LOC110730707 [Chenopodium quinoa]|uniref:uncharacterized protein LOC110730707 n=1 Tax=Chenopodium quinoa TaxID=63459 RepID=UPI000B788A40|nr:uncharacterized protein LOC110730707 [Chenopodium quinoa]
MMEKFEPLCETASLVNDQTVNMVIEALSKLQIAINECKEKKSKEHVPVVSTLSSAAEEGTISSVRNPVPSTSEHQDPCPSAIEPVIKDPIIKKRKRGMPKASRHKTLAETGYKKTTNKKKLQNNGAESDVEDDRHATKGKKAPEEKDTTKGGVGKSKGKKAPKEKDTTNGEWESLAELTEKERRKGRRRQPRELQVGEREMHYKVKEREIHKVL